MSAADVTRSRSAAAARNAPGVPARTPHVAGHFGRNPSPDGRGQHGQSSVELVAMVPLAVAAILAALQLLAAGATRELAGHAAGAGAIALLQDADPRDAARAAVPGWSRDRLRVTVRGREVTVSMRPPTFVPGMAAQLTSTVQADAGRES